MDGPPGKLDRLTTADLKTREKELVHAIGVISPTAPIQDMLHDDLEHIREILKSRSASPRRPDQP